MKIFVFMEHGLAYTDFFYLIWKFQLQAEHFLSERLETENEE